MSKLSKIFKPVARAVAAYYTAGASEAIYQARDRQKAAAAQQAAWTPPDPSLGSGGYFPSLASNMAIIPRAAPALRALPGAGSRALGPAARLAPGMRAGVRKWTRRAAQAAGLYVVGREIYDAAGNLVGRTATRRMNVANGKAVRRAIRRVAGFRKLAAKIERLLPKQRTTRCAPACPPKRC